MKIGIVLHSHTGNTKNVALRVEEELKSRGHDVVIEKLIPVDEEGSLKGNCKIQSSPDLTQYEMVVFAAPVWAFNLSGVMKEYLEQVETLEGKKGNVLCYKASSVQSFWWKQVCENNSKDGGGKRWSVSWLGYCNLGRKEKRSSD